MPQPSCLAALVVLYARPYVRPWLGDLTAVRRWIYDQEVVSLSPGRVAIKRLLPGFTTVCGRVNNCGIQQTIELNSAFHPPLINKSNTGLCGQTGFQFCRVTSNTM